MRHTMLYYVWGRDFPRFPKLVRRKDIDLTNNIAVRLKPTRRAAVIAPLRFMSVPAIGTSLGGVPFVLQHDGDPFRFCFVLNELSDLTVIPSADFLVRLLAERYFIGNVFNIAHNDSACIALNGDADNLATDLVRHIGDHPFVMGFHPRLGPNKSLVAAATSLLSGNSSV